MKKLKIIIPIIVIVLITAVILLVVIKTKPTDEKVTITPKATYTLSKPVNLSMEGDTLTWDEVDNASSYIVYIGDKSYEVSTNQFDLQGIILENDIIYVKAIGINQYLNSANSVKLVYHQDSENEDIINIQNILELFIKNIFDIEVNLSNEALHLYLNGLSSSDVSMLAEVIQSLVEENINLYNKLDKINNFQKILQNIEDYLNLDMLQYNKAFGFLNILKLYLSYRIIYPIDKVNNTVYFTGDINQQYQVTIDTINDLNSVKYQSLAATLNYLSLYLEQIKTLIGTFSLYSESANLLNDIVTIKNTLCNVLINEMPTINEYNDFIQVVKAIYSGVNSTYLKEHLKDDDVVDFLKYFYDRNYFYLNFLKLFNENDIKLIYTYIVKIEESTENEDLEHLFSEEALQELMDIINPMMEKIVNIDDYLTVDLAFLEEFNQAINSNDLNQILSLLDYDDYISFDQEIIELLLSDDFSVTDLLNNQEIRDKLNQNIKLDINGFITHAISKFVNIDNISTILYDYFTKLSEFIGRYQTVIYNIQEVMKLLKVLNEASKEGSIDIDVTTLDTDSMADIDILSVYNLYKIIYNKYTRYNLLYEKRYDIEFDIQEEAKKIPHLINYLLLGEDAKLLDDLDDDLVVLGARYKDIYDYLKLFYEETQKIIEINQKLSEYQNYTIPYMAENNLLPEYLNLNYQLIDSYNKIINGFVSLNIMDDLTPFIDSVIVLAEYYSNSDLTKLKELNHNISSLYHQYKEEMVNLIGDFKNTLTNLDELINKIPDFSFDDFTITGDDINQAVEDLSNYLSENFGIDKEEVKTNINNIIDYMNNLLEELRNYYNN